MYFADQTFSFELLRAASYGLYGGSEIGEALATAKQIREGDFESWHIAWQRTALRVEARRQPTIKAIATRGSPVARGRARSMGARGS